MIPTIYNPEAGNLIKKANVEYRAHVDGHGITDWYKENTHCGVQGEFLTGIYIKLTSLPNGVSGDIIYETNLTGIGWTGNSKNGELSGVSVSSDIFITAFKIKLDGDLSKYFDVYYEAFVDTVGWAGWKKNGETAGDGKNKILFYWVKLVHKHVENHDFDSAGLGFLKDVLECTVVEEKNGGFTLSLTYPTGTKYDEYFDNDYQIKAKPNDLDNDHVFIITNKAVDTFTDTVTITAVSRTYKLGRRNVRQCEIKDKTGAQAMQLIEMNMDLISDVALYSDISTTSSTTFEARNVLNCIAGEQGSLLQYWGGIIKRENFRLSLLSKRGRDNVCTIRYGKDLTGLSTQWDWSNIITKMTPYADIQNSEGETERIYGDDVYSPIINNYSDVYSDYVQFTEDQGVTDLKSLNRVAANYFTTMNPDADKPKVTLKLEIEPLMSAESDNELSKEFAKMRRLSIGDTVTIYHKRYDINLTAEVIAIEYDVLNEKVLKATVGNAQYTFYQKQQYDLSDTLKSIPTKHYASEFVDYVTKIISGNDGGNVVWWPKNRPSDLFFINTENLEDATEVLRINKSGIGFGKNWQGPFTTAWTLDGTFNANFIKAGTLEGIKIRSVNDNFAIQMDQGILSFRRIENGKETELFAFAPTFVENVLKGVNMIKAPGYEFGLSAQGQDGTYLNLLHIPADSSPSDLKMTLYGKVNVDGDLLIKGQQVYPGQGGSGNGEWDGEYPPGVTSQADKFAWELWVYLLSKGYSKAAAAGILGNVQGEVGAGMNPDTAQSGGSGPGYGIVQWDGSSYPLVGAPTWNGRQYVQNLMNAAGITEDYKTMKAQAKLLDWCMYNGQWLGAVQPTSVAGFKAMADPKQAAYVFEKNFERPATSHPEREGWAQEWYNKFKDLEITSGNKILTVAKSLLGYFHYSQPLRNQFGTVENPDPNGYADCSSFVWLVLTKAGCKTPANVGWYTGSMTADARGAKNWLQEINQVDAKAGDIVIVNQGSGAGNDGHTAILTENWNGYNTKIIEMGGANSNGVGYGVISTSFGWLLNGGDVCVARAKR